MYKLKLATLAIVIIASIMAFTSCNAISDSLSSSDSPAKDEASTGDYEAMAINMFINDNVLYSLRNKRQTYITNLSPKRFEILTEPPNSVYYY